MRPAFVISPDSESSALGATHKVVVDVSRGGVSNRGSHFGCRCWSSLPRNRCVRVNPKLIPRSIFNSSSNHSPSLDRMNPLKHLI